MINSFENLMTSEGAAYKGRSNVSTISVRARLVLPSSTDILVARESGLA